MTPEKLEKFRQLLLKLQEELVATSDVRNESTGTVHLDQQSVGRLSRMDALQGQALAKASQERAERQLRMIEAALIARARRGDAPVTTIQTPAPATTARPPKYPSSPRARW